MAVLDNRSAIGAKNRKNTSLGLKKDAKDHRLTIVDDKLAAENNKLAINNNRSAAKIDKKIDINDRLDI